MNSQDIIILFNQLNSIESRLKKIEKQLEELKPIKESAKKMDNHIEKVMGIYSGYKGTLDYVSSFFNGPEIEDVLHSPKQIENHKEDS